MEIVEEQTKLRNLFKEGKIDLDEFKNMTFKLGYERLSELREPCIELFRQRKLTDDEFQEKLTESYHICDKEFVDIYDELDILIGYKKEMEK